MATIEITVKMTVDASFYLGEPEQAARHLLRCIEVRKLPQGEEVQSFEVVSAEVKS